MNWTYKSLTFRYSTFLSDTDIDIEYGIALAKIMDDSGTPLSTTIVRRGANFVCTIIYQSVKIS